MKLLLDTHVFLWFLSGDPCLASKYVASIRDPGNAVWLSVVSVWEAMIKHQLGDLPLLHRDPFDRMLICQAIAHDLTIITVDEAIRAYAVPVL